MDDFHHQRHVLAWLDGLARDVGHALRSLKRSPGFTVVTLLTLALGIGANTAIFSFVNGVILRPLGYPHPEQLMYLTTRYSEPQEFWFAVPEYIEFRDINKSFAAVGAYVTGEVNLLAPEQPLRVRAAIVDEHLLDALGVRAAQGRLFAKGETNETASATAGTALAGTPLIAILSYEVWQSAFGRQPLIGKTVDVNGRPHEVIGIMKAGADLMDNHIEIWLPLGLGPAGQQDRGSHNLWAIGRLKDGVTAQSAQAEIDALMTNWGERVGLRPGDHVFTPLTSDDGHVVAMRPLQEKILGDAGRSIWVLQAGVGLVLLIVCANLANLLLARAETRRHELAMRVALGASRGRLLRQFITEGVLLSISGGLLGVWVAAIGVRALIYAYPTSLPRTSEVSIDLPVLMFALTVSMVTGVLVGAAPASRKHVTALATTLKDAGDRRTSGVGRHHLRRALVVVEVALAVMLVIGAGLLVRTVYNLTKVDAGFEPTRLVTFQATVPQAPPVRQQMYQRLLNDLRGIPGVRSATAVWGLPPNRAANFNNTGFDAPSALSGEPARPRYEVVDYDQFVMSDYFETMGIPIIAGRSFQPTDAGPETTVVVINETLAKKVWPGLNPIGRRLRRCCGDQMPWLTVVGMAKDVKQGGVDRAVGTEFYVFVEQQPTPPQTMNFVLRTTLPPAALSPTIERVVRNVDATIPIVRLRDMDAVFADSIRRPRLLAQLLGGFAGLALLLAAIGTYGIVSYMVTERQREIGIRMALGAGRSRVIARVMGQGLTLTTIGIVVGITGALWLNSLIASLLFGVQPTDETTMTAVIATIAIVAGIACALPAFRASRLDPNVVLRTN